RVVGGIVWSRYELLRVARSIVERAGIGVEEVVQHHSRQLACRVQPFHVQRLLEHREKAECNRGLVFKKTWYACSPILVAAHDSPVDHHAREKKVGVTRCHVAEIRAAERACSFDEAAQSEAVPAG